MFWTLLKESQGRGITEDKRVTENKAHYNVKMN